MKIDRLIGIIVALQQKRQWTAPELAQRFEVSVRTIQRDVETISQAGIPIVTTQGKGGGISLMEGFCLDTTVFTKEELSGIFTGLRSLHSVSKDSRWEMLSEKIGGGADRDNTIQIDLSSFYKDQLAQKIELLKEAISSRRRVRFHYYYNKGEADKYIEPYRILFLWSDWYVFGFCTQRQDFRMYKLKRLWELEVTGEEFVSREIPEEKLRFGSHMTDDYFITAIYDPSVKYRLVEEYGPECFSVQEDGSLYTRWGFTDPERAVSWFLGFGDKVIVQEPEEFVRRMKEKVARIAKNYEET